MDCCRECSSGALLDDNCSGDVICTDCGLVQPERLYLSVKSPYRDSDDVPKNHQTDLTKRWPRRMEALSAYTSSVERSLSRARVEITHCADSMHMTSVSVQCAMELFSMARASTVTRGQKRKGLMAASVYHACKLEHHPRSSKEIARAFGIDRKILKKQINALVMHVDAKMCDAINSLPVTIEGLLSRSLARLSRSPREKMAIQKECLRILSLVTYDEFFSSRRPSSVVSGLVLVATRILGVNVPPSDCASSAGVSVVTTNYIAKVIQDRVDRTKKKI